MMIILQTISQRRCSNPQGPKRQLVLTRLFFLNSILKKNTSNIQNLKQTISSRNLSLSTLRKRICPSSQSQLLMMIQVNVKVETASVRIQIGKTNCHLRNTAKNKSELKFRWGSDPASISGLSKLTNSKMELITLGLMVNNMFYMHLELFIDCFGMKHKPKKKPSASID